jgi:hypothetical protein
MRKTIGAPLVLIAMLMAGPSPAAAATVEVGLFSWDWNSELFGFPIFSFELGYTDLTNLSVELETDQGVFTSLFTYPIDSDADGILESSPTIPAGESVLTFDFPEGIAGTAFILLDGIRLSLWDEFDMPLVDGDGNPRGLTSIGESRRVIMDVPEPPPPTGVPEPATVLLVGFGLAGAFVSSRQLRPRRQ